MSRRVVHIVLLLILFPLCIHAKDKENRKVLVRMYAGPVLAFYHNNEDYTINTHSRMSVNTGIRFEYMINGYNSICMAPEYLTHSLSFDSYYFAPGQLELYDKSFPYTHTVRLHEAQLPFLFKYNFTKENDKIMNGYLLAGWGYRYILDGESTITQVNNSSITWNGKIDATMEYHLLSPHDGSMLLAGGGFERNYQNEHRGIYGELLFKYGLSRFNYPGSGTTVPFFIKDSFLCINLGYKF